MSVSFGKGNGQHAIVKGLWVTVNSYGPFRAMQHCNRLTCTLQSVCTLYMKRTASLTVVLNVTETVLLDVNIRDRTSIFDV